MILLQGHINLWRKGLFHNREITSKLKKQLQFIKIHLRKGQNMKWTAIDLGQAEIKAAVCNTSSNKPERLVYNEGLSYSYMPHGVVVSNDEVYIGHQVLLLAAMGVDGVVSKIMRVRLMKKS